MNRDPPAAVTPNRPDSDEFVVIIATSFEPDLADAYADIVRFALPDAKPKIVIADSRSIPDLVKMPGFADAALVLVAMSNLQGDARPDKKGPFLDWGTWMEKRVRLMRTRTKAHLICMSGLDRLDAFKGMERGGADTVIQVPVRASELEPVIVAAYNCWVEKRRKRTPASVANEQGARAAATEPKAAEVRSTKRTRTILVDNDNFGKFFEELLNHYLSDYFDLKFVRFETEARLRELAASGAADLICLYIGTVAWDTPPKPPPESDPSKPRKDCVRHGIDVLGELSARYRVPVIATQGTDLRAEATRAGIHFLEAPFTLADLLPVVRSALGLDPPPDPAPGVVHEAATLLHHAVQNFNRTAVSALEPEVSKGSPSKLMSPEQVDRLRKLYQKDLLALTIIPPEVLEEERKERSAQPLDKSPDPPS